MTEREIRLCIAGTVSEAIAQLIGLNAAGADPEKIAARLEAAEGEIMRARQYLAELLKVQDA